jgi:hypothetical protein
VRFGPLAGDEQNLRFVTEINEHTNSAVKANGSTNRVTMRAGCVAKKAVHNEVEAERQGE